MTLEINGFYKSLILPQLKSQGITLYFRCTLSISKTHRTQENQYNNDYALHVNPCHSTSTYQSSGRIRSLPSICQKPTTVFVGVSSLTSSAGLFSTFCSHPERTNMNDTRTIATMITFLIAVSMINRLGCQILTSRVLFSTIWRSFTPALSSIMVEALTLSESGYLLSR